MILSPGRDREMKANDRSCDRIKGEKKKWRLVIGAVIGSVGRDSLIESV